MTLVSTVTVGSGGAASIVFSSIPQTATDLVILISGRCTTTSNEIYLDFNGGSSVQSERRLVGDGSTTASQTSTDGWIASMPKSSFTANTFGSTMVYIPNYTAAVNKSISVDDVNENNASNADQVIRAMLWASTAAITSLTLVAANFAQHSTASLYTITKGSGGATVS
jgi:hypothetical protein